MPRTLAWRRPRLQGTPERRRDLAWRREHPRSKSARAAVYIVPTHPTVTGDMLAALAARLLRGRRLNA